MTKNKTDKKFSSKHMSIRLNASNYSKLMYLKRHSHAKSLAKIINLLLIDEFQRPISLNNQNLITCKDKLIKFNEMVGKLDADLNQIGNNWNQIAYKLNLAEMNSLDSASFLYRKNHGPISFYNVHKIMMYLYENMGVMESRIKHIDKEVTKLWQLLM